MCVCVFRLFTPCPEVICRLVGLSEGALSFVLSFGVIVAGLGAAAAGSEWLAGGREGGRYCGVRLRREGDQGSDKGIKAGR